MVNDTISDLLTRIRNAQRAGHKTVGVSISKASKRLLDVLLAEGYIGSIETAKNAKTERDEYKVFLKYDRNGFPAITKVVRHSKPGCRKYLGKDELPKVHSGLGIAIVSSSQGVLTDREARRRGVGGELLATVF